jgi:hypothetical protein
MIWQLDQSRVFGGLLKGCAGSIVDATGRDPVVSTHFPIVSPD